MILIFFSCWICILGDVISVDVRLSLTVSSDSILKSLVLAFVHSPMITFLKLCWLYSSLCWKSLYKSTTLSWLFSALQETYQHFCISISFIIQNLFIIRFHSHKRLKSSTSQLFCQQWITAIINNNTVTETWSFLMFS